MLHTVMPLELVFGSEQQDDMAESTYLGKTVVCSVDRSGSRKIVRLLSTDPQDYLDPRFYPGASIQG